MRLFFHAMLGLAVGIVAVGLLDGIVARPPALDRASVRSRASDEHDRVLAEMAILPPTPLLPRYGEQVTSRVPMLWHLEEGTDGARVELCRTPDFDATTTRHIDVHGDRLDLPAGWPEGAWYWRLRGREDGMTGTRVAPTWMLFVAPEPSNG